ncbi:MAG: outer membrane protein [Myxococcaceae bacterium]|nr:outer membrane protein [Myxococcaceae bacterium]
MTRKSAVSGSSLFLGLAAGLALTVATVDARAQSSNVSFGGSASTSNGATGTGSAAAAAPAPAAPEDEWADRDRKLNEGSSLSGAVGLLHMRHAQGGAPGQLRIGFTSEYFSSGFLCTPEFPCKNPRGAGNLTDDTLDHIGGTLTLSATITKWLEGYASTGAYANSDTANRPTLVQVLGDTDFGVKAFGALSKVFWIGGFAELWLINGTGAVGLASGGTSFKLGPIVTADLRGTQSKTPLRFSFQLDYMFDNTGDVLSTTEKNRGAPVTRIERYGLKVNRVDHVDLALGGEVFLAQEKVRPFLEYNILVPTNRQNYLCKPNNPSGDHCMANDAIAPSSLTIGGRFFPWKQGFNLLAAFDIGVTGTKTFVEELSPTAPWTLFIGAGWNVDTQDRPPTEHLKMVEKVIEKNANLGRFKGFVHEKDKSDAIPLAIISWDNHPELTSLATGTDGRFTTQGLPEGNYVFGLKAEGFKDGTCTGSLAKGSTQDIQIDCPMEALPRVGSVVGHVKDADTQAGVSGAQVKMTDSAKQVTDLVADSSGNFRAERVAPGTASFAVEADGYMALVQPSDIKVRTENQIDLVVRKRPKVGLVNVGKTEITMKQQIQFAVDSAVILPESLQLMSEIADALIRTPRIKSVEIQGHTDNSGTADHNKTLSEQRAGAVREWLTSHGVDAGRLSAKGYGQEKPLVPNVTTSNKARNRRVQFIIVDQDAPAPATKAAPKPAAKP